MTRRENETPKNGTPKTRSGSYSVYILLCDNGSYYTGYTNNVESRLERHMKGRGARYTKMRRPERIVYLQRFKTRRAAMRRERQIKTLDHDEKRELARSFRLSTVP